MSPMTERTTKICKLYLIYLYIDVIQCVCGLNLSVNIRCLEAYGMRTQVVVNKTTPGSVFDTIYFNQIYKVLDMALVVLVRKYPFDIPTGPQCDLKHPHDMICLYCCGQGSVRCMHLFPAVAGTYPHLS